MNARYDIELFNEMLYEAFKKQDEETDFAKYLDNALRSGEKTLYQKHSTERKKYDDTWINVIESYLPSIDKITRNVKSQLKFEEEIIPIEKTKRVNSQSIRHLSTNTKYLRETESLDLMPLKVLTNIGEIEYGIYENRFIMTLIARLKDYTFERLKLIKEALYANRKMNFLAENNFEFIDANYKVKIEVSKEEKFRQKKEDDHNEAVYQKAENLYKHITVLTNSTFYKQMSKYKKVTPPIIKTQVILKNPDFKSAYFLWLFLDQNYKLDYNFEAETHNKRFTDYYKENINKLFMHAVSLTLSNDTQYQSVDQIEYQIKKEVPAKILKNLHTEITLDDKYADVVENQAMNEYFLQKIKSQTSKNSVEYKGDLRSQKVHLKTALTDIFNIQNSLYEDILAYNSDTDLFTKLYEAKSLDKKLEIAYKKQAIASIVRDVKLEDLRRHLSLERKWNEELKKLYKEIEKNEANSLNERIKKYTIDNKEKLDKAIKRKLALENKKLSNELKREKDKLLRERLKLEKALKEKRKKLALKEKNERLKIQAKLEKQKALELEKKLAKQKKTFDAKKEGLAKKKAQVLDQNKG
ncbi:hypothetical protein [Acholeplasma hippikon]|uniref:DUF2357 domain-containing protein n=1 Tax=Acholeplasma hippikon TaxID=264636 RepID=A0A449BLD0_9MOLU|nr:hypothetical protein [Acholeplasma hippikon]VEU83235.1 Uncharacterised protein [Acholeplasma hippikon]